MTAAPSPARLKARRMGFTFHRPIPRHWLRRDAVRTHLLDSAGLLFPRLEDFLIRVARDTEERRGSEAPPALRAFITQEAQHLTQHRKVFAHLRAHDYPVDAIVGRFDRFVGRFDELDYDTRLAIAAAGEHFTSIASAHLLGRKFLEGAHAELGALFAWHFAEEIEHKSVIYDEMVRERVGHHHRAIGLLVGFSIPLAVIAGMLEMLAADEILGKRDTLREIARLSFTEEALIPLFVRGAIEFMREDFHPSQHDDDAIATAAFDSTLVKAFERSRAS